MSERLACKAVGLARSSYRRIPVAQTSADPDAELRTWLRDYSAKHPCHGFRRAWAALRHDEHRDVNKKKVHRLWKEEGLQRRVHSPRKRAGVSSWPGPELISQALQSFCAGKVGLSYIPPGAPWDNGYIESFNNRLRRECLNRNHWTNLLEARVVIDDFKHEHNRRHRHSALGYLTPAEYAARCSHTHHPVACEIN